METKTVGLLEKFQSTRFYLNWIHPLLKLITRPEPVVGRGASLREVTRVTKDHKVDQVLHCEDGTTIIALRKQG